MYLSSQASSFWKRGVLSPRPEESLRPPLIQDTGFLEPGDAWLPSASKRRTRCCGPCPWSSWRLPSPEAPSPRAPACHVAVLGARPLLPPGRSASHRWGPCAVALGTALLHADLMGPHTPLGGLGAACEHPCTPSKPTPRGMPLTHSLAGVSSRPRAPKSQVTSSPRVPTTSTRGIKAPTGKKERRVGNRTHSLGPGPSTALVPP